MKRQFNPYRVAIYLVVALLFSCGSQNEKINQVPKIHAELIGKWIQKDSTENINWEFSQYEVKWKGFTHFYKVNGDSLSISGIVYIIDSIDEKQLKLMSHTNGRSILLDRLD